MLAPNLPALAPSGRLFLGEALAFPSLVLGIVQPAVPIATGRGPVVVMPGFMAHDVMTARLRRSLDAAGYAAQGWGLGRNLGVREGLLERLSADVAALAERSAAPVSLVGWSLGGIFAREVAKQVPGSVRGVITLGSPFSGDLRANNAWRLYEFVAGHRVDAPPVEVDIPAKPPVPTVALWSYKDGIVAPAAAAGQPGERDEAIEVDCRHLGFTCSPVAIRAIGSALTQLG